MGKVSFSDDIKAIASEWLTYYPGVERTAGHLRVHPDICPVSIHNGAMDQVRILEPFKSSPGFGKVHELRAAAGGTVMEYPWLYVGAMARTILEG